MKVRRLPQKCNFIQQENFIVFNSEIEAHEVDLTRDKKMFKQSKFVNLEL